MYRLKSRVLSFFFGLQKHVTTHVSRASICDAHRQFDPSGERARMIDFRKQQQFYGPKRECFSYGFLFPQFFYIVLCERIENRTPKNAEERPETIESSQSLHRLAIERVFRQSSNARAREEVDSNLGIFLSKIHLSSGPPGEKAVQIAFC